MLLSEEVLPIFSMIGLSYEEDCNTSRITMIDRNGCMLQGKCASVFETNQGFIS